MSINVETLQGAATTLANAIDGFGNALVLSAWLVATAIILAALVSKLRINP